MIGAMVRPREFDRDIALEQALKVFWAKSFAATSTDDLLQAMGIGRQSLYNAFGDKRRLYLEAIAAYVQRTTDAHLERLNDPASPAEGLRNLLYGLVVSDNKLRAMGCMGVGSVGEFGTSDPELAALRAKGAPLLSARLIERLREGQTKGEIDPAIAPADAAAFIQVTMAGMQLAARGGAGAGELRKIALFATDRLRANHSAHGA